MAAQAIRNESRASRPIGRSTIRALLPRLSQIVELVCFVTGTADIDRRALQTAGDWAQYALIIYFIQKILGGLVTNFALFQGGAD